MTYHQASQTPWILREEFRLWMLDVVLEPGLRYTSILFYCFKRIHLLLVSKMCKARKQPPKCWVRVGVNDKRNRAGKYHSSRALYMPSMPSMLSSLFLSFFALSGLVIVSPI